MGMERGEGGDGKLEVERREVEQTRGRRRKKKKQIKCGVSNSSQGSCRVGIFCVPALRSGCYILVE